MNKIQLLLILFVPFTASSQIEIGTKAPEINLDGIYNKVDEKIPTLESLEGNIVILDFWATWCSPCIAAFPRNNELYNLYRDRNVYFIAITDDPKERLENFLSKVKVDFWIGRDDDKQDFLNYKVKGRPQMFIINRDGIIVYQGSQVTEEMIQEVIKTNSVTIPQRIDHPQVILDGGFAPGEDPLYNGVGMMLGKEPSNRPRLINHFIIRPSLDTTWGGSGYRMTADGYVGVTYYGGKLEDIFQFLNKLSSSVWIKNHTKDHSLYDVIYWKRAESVEKALSEIQQRLINGLSIKFDSLPSKESVNVLSLQKPNEDIKKPEQIEEGNYALYTSISTFISELEIKSQKLFLVDDSLQDMLIYNQGMDWNKMNNADPSEIINFLNSKGITLKQKMQTVTIYHINNK